MGSGPTAFSRDLARVILFQAYDCGGFEELDPDAPAPSYPSKAELQPPFSPLATDMTREEIASSIETDIDPFAITAPDDGLIHYWMPVDGDDVLLTFRPCAAFVSLDAVRALQSPGCGTLLTVDIPCPLGSAKP